MREIKFRAWDKEGHRMIEEPYHFETYHYSDENRTNQQTWCFYEGWRDLEDGRKIECELMQFTGLKDKKGKDIYEGDIVIAANGYKGKIEFGIWCYEDDYSKVEGIGFSWDGEEPLSSCHTGQSYEIIGNIYENPDLLK